MLIILAGLAAAPVAAAPDPAPEILVTATDRPRAVAEAPLAATIVTADRLQASGTRDIRDLTQLVPSLLVSSSSNEAGGGGARIRGIGTVGDNAGLESSVASYVDGVYRPRAAVALTELGPVDRIEVLRGPQGTLFGRNASAGLIAVTTAAPSASTGGYAEAGFGNYASKRLAAGLTGPLASTLTARIDGVWFERRGFVEDVVSGRHINDRDRWLGRAKLRWAPDASFTATLIADYAHRDEECCAGVYLPARDLRSTTPGAPGGGLVVLPSSIAALIRATPSAVPGARSLVLEDSYARKVALTLGQSFRQDVRDGGVSLALEKRLGSTVLSSITAWRSNRFIKGQDADFSALDLTQRPSDGSGFIRFRNFSQELRARGQLLDDRVEWLVGAYLGDEHLTLQDNFRYGLDYDAFASARTALSGGAFAALPAYGFANLKGFARAYGGDAVAALVDNVPLSNTGELDRFRQHDSNQALFTHEVVHLTPRLALTLGARFTRDRKTLDANLTSTSNCNIYIADIARLRASGLPAGVALANGILAPLAGYPCNINSLAGTVRDRRTERRWSGTAAFDYRIAEDLNAYASWSRGYKAGGYNLDRAALFSVAAISALPTSALRFKPETVDALEAGARLHRGAFDLDVTIFRQLFSNFQLNAYTGSTFIVSNIAGCADALGTTDSDNVANNSACAGSRAGVISKGVEVEAALRPARDVALTAAATYADTRYRRDIAGTPDALTGNNSLQPVLFRLPGRRLSNAPAWTATGSARWSPGVGSLRALLYADLRWQSRFNTGSDLLVEKEQKPFATVNARIGLSNARWSAQLWAQNLFDVNYRQVAFSEPLQGGGSGGLPGTAAAVAGFGTSSTQLFGAFLGEPRTWGVTLGYRF